MGGHAWGPARRDLFGHTGEDAFSVPAVLTKRRAASLRRVPQSKADCGTRVRNRNPQCQPHFKDRPR